MHLSVSSDDKKPSIFDYLDLVLFLQTHFQWRKKQEFKFSYAAWCTELNLGSKTLLRFILQRKRRVSTKTALVIKSNLRLNQEESEYFNFLICYSQPRSESERSSAGAKLIQLQRAQYKRINLDAVNTTHDVLGPIIITLLTFKDFTANVQNISEFLKIPLERTAVLMQKFLDSKIVTYNENENIYFLKADAFRTPDSPQLSSLLKFHEYWLEKSKEALQLDFDSRRFRSLKFALSESEFALAVEHINNFAVSILNQFQNNSLSGRRLYMIENVLFPITDQFQA